MRDFTVSDLLKLKMDYFQQHGILPNRFRIGKQALDALLRDIDVEGGILHEVEGMTPELSGIDWVVVVYHAK